MQRTELGVHWSYRASITPVQETVEVEVFDGLVSGVDDSQPRWGRAPAEACDAGEGPTS